MWEPITRKDVDLAKTPPPNVEWLDAPILLINGTAGSGKTTFAKTWCLLSGALYCSTLQLIEHLRNNCNGKNGVRDIGKHLKKLYDAPRLVIDDLVNEPRPKFNVMGTEYRPREIFRTAMLARCKPGKRTMVITNAPLHELYKTYDESEDEDGRLHSRMQEFMTHYKFLGDLRPKDKDGKPINKFKLEKHKVASAVCTVPIIPVVERLDAMPETESAEIKATLRDLADKPELVDVYCGWLKTTEFKNLIPKEYYERAAEKKKAEAARHRAEKKADAKPGGSDRAVAGGGGAGVSDKLQPGAVDGTGGGAGGADGGAAVNPKAMPGW